MIKHKKMMEKISKLFNRFAQHTSDSNIDILIKNRKICKGKLFQMTQDGLDKLQVISDFDRTMSSYMFNGKRNLTTHGLLECELSPEIKKQFVTFQKKYYPIEVDPTMSNSEKTPYMVEWWSKLHDLVGTLSLHKDVLVNTVHENEVLSQKLAGCPLFMKTLADSKVPLLIFSAGIGNVIHELLKHQRLLYDNVRIVSNFMNFNNEGILTGFSDRIIHTFNKTGKSIQDSEFFENICTKRKNIILIGDSTGDPHMSDGFSHDGHVLKIGFLNADAENLKETYMDIYDIVLVTDETFSVPAMILETIINNEAIL